METLEIKTAFGELNKAFTEFKDANDQRLKEIESKGSADVLLEEKTVKINEAISETEKRVESLELRFSRPDMDIKGTVEDLEYKKAFNSFIRKGRADGLEAKAMSVNSDTDGGYLVPTFMAGIVNTRLTEISPMRQVANVVTISTDALELIDDNGAASAEWVGEVQERIATETPKLGKRRIETHEISAKPLISQKMVDDAQVDIEAWLSDKIATAFDKLEGDAFLAGTGVGQPTGLLKNIASWGGATHSTTAFEQIDSAGSGAINLDDVYNLIAAIKQGYDQRSQFIASRSIISELRKLKDDQGQYLWQPSHQAGVPSNLAGYPIRAFTGMAKTVVTGAVAVGFGDFQQAYTIVDRIGIRMLRDPFTTKPYVEYYTNKRVGGAPLNMEAAKFLKIA